MYLKKFNNGVSLGYLRRRQRVLELLRCAHHCAVNRVHSPLLRKRGCGRRYGRRRGSQGNGRRANSGRRGDKRRGEEAR
jgi:hypothetical protein